MKKNILIGGYDTQHELKDAIERAESNGYQKENLVIVSKDGANLDSFADNYGVNLKIVGSQELGNQRFLDSVKALFMGEDPATSSGIDPDKKDGTRFDEHDLDEYASMVFDGKYVLIVDHYGTYPSAQNESQVQTEERAEAYRESASAREEVLKVKEEQLDIKKLAEKSGDVEVTKKVVEEQQNVDVPVSHEEAFIKRRKPANSTADTQTLIDEEETIRVPLKEEILHVEKKPVVTEEIVIGKRKVQDTETITEKVKHEEVDIKANAELDTDGRLNKDKL
ncbi:YsnF/AvaK domain-containing protein [Bacillus sp. ISL-47]|uniref:YsnF/AvaK domain-containing protein n=1 Tax=Bacillus sp. ISL-47 TaxID=2819130 RepID=UPI001BECE049|nr:YsnF/AvaK domain-containing protein [Bacillus sp. ISL-47]MBT2690684.1 YsnF/AvaK domain-containing protein [Bacillus sp. ISL-47]MBT2709629.1 YsnF/AvaK domain-containing protein [Pseudomonas sp. ISL-84]